MVAKYGGVGRILVVMPLTVDAEMLAAALAGYQIKATEIKDRIADLKRQLAGEPAPAAPVEDGKRSVSSKARRRMAAAQKKRWAAVRKARAAAAEAARVAAAPKPVAKKAAPPKPKPVTKKAAAPKPKPAAAAKIVRRVGAKKPAAKPAKAPKPAPAPQPEAAPPAAAPVS